MAFVNRGSIMYFPSMPWARDSKTDALYWTLFGQLAADARYNRGLDPIAWYQEYVRILRLAGMTVTERERKSASGVDAGESVDAAVSKYLKPFLSAGAQGQLDGILNALKKPVNSKPLSIFNASASNGLGAANFQVSDVTFDNRSGDLTFHVGFMDFKANQRTPDLLFSDWVDREFTLNYASVSMTLPKRIADVNRFSVYNRVVNHIPANVAQIELA